jgi:hypothetical protein
MQAKYRLQARVPSASHTFERSHNADAPHISDRAHVLDVRHIPPSFERTAQHPRAAWISRPAFAAQYARPGHDDHDPARCTNKHKNTR